MPESLGSAVITVGADTSGLQKQVATGTDKAFSKTDGSAAKKAGAKSGKSFVAGFGKPLAAIAGLSALTRVLRNSVAEGRESIKVGKLTAQVIKTTGGAANVTADQIGVLSTAISNKIGVDDEAIQSGANLLLTFKNVRNEVGKGNAVFNRALRASTDLSAAGFGALAGTSKQLGKALNDPVKGISALARAGVTFTAKQKETIKSLVETGDILSAQKIILKEVESQVGGAAAAQVTAADKAKVAWGNLQEQIGTALIPVLDDLAEVASEELIPAVSKFFTEMQTGTGVGGQFADVLGTIRDTAKGVVLAIDALPGPVKKYGLQLALGALAISKFSTAMSSMKFAGFISGLTNTETRAATATRGLNNLGAGLRNLAGAGGMLAVVHGAQNTNEALGALELAAGGAALGFAVGGPLGAAIGGTAGGLFGLTKAFNETATATNNAITPQDTYTTTLKVGTQAITAQTRALVAKEAQEDHAISNARKLGLSSQTVVNAMMGYPPALAKVANAQKRAEQAAAGLNVVYDETGSYIVSVTETATKAQREQARAAAELGQTIGQNYGVLKRDIIANNERALSLGKYNQVLKGVPPAVQTRIDQIGLAQAETNIVALTRKYDLTPDQVETILRASGTEPTNRQIDSVIARAKELDRQAPMVPVDANTKPARDKTNTLMTWIRGLTGVVTVNAQRGTGLDSLFPSGPGTADGGTIRRAAGGTVPGQRTPYGDKVMTALAPGEEVISNRRGQADRFRPLLKAINAGGMADGGTVAMSRGVQQMTGAASQQPIIFEQNFYGPTTSGGRLREIDWTLRYATKARAVRHEGVAS